MVMMVMENHGVRMVMIGHWSPSSGLAALALSLSLVFLEVPQMSEDVGAKEIHSIKILTHHSTAVRTRGRIFNAHTWQDLRSSIDCLHLELIEPHTFDAAQSIARRFGQPSAAV